MAIDGQQFQEAPDDRFWWHLDEGIWYPARDYAQTVEERARTFTGPASALPEQLQLLAEIASEQAEQPFNTVSLYRYPVGEYDGAYSWHISPEGYKGKIAMVTLDGFADMELQRGVTMHSFGVYSGKLIIANTTDRRKLSPPQQGQERRAVYLGWAG